MAVPDTTTFSLQDVIDVVNPTSDDLTDCFTDAVSNKFNAAYKVQYYADAGDKNNLLMFRDYGAGVSNVLTVESTSQGFPPVGLILIGNWSVPSQTITYTWQYVSHEQPGSEVEAIVQLGEGGTTVAVGYTSPALTATLSSDNQAFYWPNYFYTEGGNNVRLTFKLVLLTAETDTVPSSPDNEALYSICFNCE